MKGGLGMNAGRSLFVVFVVLVTFQLWALSSYAHNGALDELGGHFINKDCVYLLHEPTSLTHSTNNIKELMNLIQQYNSNDCKHGLTESKVDLEGYTFGSEPSASNATKPNLKSAKATGSTIQLGQTYAVTLERCVDGDTAVFEINGASYNTRFLFIDTPESTREKEAFGQEASDFSCRLLENGNLSIQTDGDTLFDKYDRLLAWVFVGGLLLQEEITKAGLVEDFYDFGSYEYENRIRSAMIEAKENRLGMYMTSESNEQDDAKEKQDEAPKPTPPKQNEEEEVVKESGATSAEKEQSAQTLDESTKEEEESSPSLWVIAVVIAIILIYFLKKK